MTNCKLAALAWQWRKLASMVPGVVQKPVSRQCAAKPVLLLLAVLVAAVATLGPAAPASYVGIQRSRGVAWAAAVARAGLRWKLWALREALWGRLRRASAQWARRAAVWREVPCGVSKGVESRDEQVPGYRTEEGALEEVEELPSFKVRVFRPPPPSECAQRNVETWPRPLNSSSMSKLISSLVPKSLAMSTSTSASTSASSISSNFSFTPTSKLRVDGGYIKGAAMSQPRAGNDIWQNEELDTQNQNNSIPVVLFLHGGEFLDGSAASPEYHELCSDFAQAGFVVVCPDYRIGRQNPFPAAVEDAYRCLAWIVSGGLGSMPPEADCSRIILVGDSNGGGLAAVLSSLARDELTGTLEDSDVTHDFEILHQVIINGWLFMNDPLWEAREPSPLSSREIYASRERFRGSFFNGSNSPTASISPTSPPSGRRKSQPFVTNFTTADLINATRSGLKPQFSCSGDSVGEVVDVYLPACIREEALADRRCSPWLAGLHDLPSTTVVAASRSPFFVENLRYGERAFAMGNVVEKHIIDDVHNFLTVPISPNRRPVLDAVLRRLKMYLESVD